MAKYVIEDTTLNNTANAIREKTGKTDKITPSNFATEIASIESGGSGSNSELKIEVQEYTPASNETIHEFTHNLGVVPDKIEIYSHSNTLYGANLKNVLYYATGIRKPIFSLGKTRYAVQNCFFRASDIGYTMTTDCSCLFDWDNDIAVETSTQNSNICSANSQKFNFDGTNSGLKLGGGKKYIIILISGVNV